MDYEAMTNEKLLDEIHKLTRARKALKAKQMEITVILEFIMMLLGFQTSQTIEYYEVHNIPLFDGVDDSVVFPAVPAFYNVFQRAWSRT